VAGRVAPRLSYDRWYFGRADYAAAVPRLVQAAPELIIANDWSALPAAVRAAEIVGAKVIADLHEYAPLQLGNRKAWKALIAPMIDEALRRYAPRVSAFVTVNETIAERYRREYGFSSTVVMNVPESSSSTPFHATAPEHIRLVHHGNAAPERRLELMIEMLAHAERRFSLHFMLINDGGSYLAKLRTLAQRIAPGRVAFEPAVAPSEIVPTIAGYDVGCYLLPPVNYNQHAALPNKFFDFISAGLALVVGPSPEMARLAKRYAVGVVTEDFDPVRCAQTLNGLGAAEIDAMKRASAVAREHLSAQHELDKLEALCTRVLGAA